MRRMLLGCGSAAVFAGVLALGSGALLAQAQSEEFGARWGEGADRVCNVVVDRNADPVISNEGVVIQNQTFDCPEVVAMVEPAAPPAALPASGLLLFDFDKYNLNPEAQASLDDIIFDIKDRELGGIMVGGHTDTAGPPDYNMTLSQERANTVATELIKNGVPARIVTTEAFGETDLAVPTPDNTPDQANRRVTVDFSR